MGLYSCVGSQTKTHTIIWVCFIPLVSKPCFPLKGHFSNLVFSSIKERRTSGNNRGRESAPGAKASGSCTSHNATWLPLRHQLIRLEIRFSGVIFSNFRKLPPDVPQKTYNCCSWVKSAESSFNVFVQFNVSTKLTSLPAYRKYKQYL